MSLRWTMSLGDTLLHLLFRFIVNMVYGAYLPCSYVGSDGVLCQHFLENVCIIVIIIIIMYDYNKFSYKWDMVITINQNIIMLFELSVTFTLGTAYIQFILDFLHVFVSISVVTDSSAICLDSGISTDITCL